MGWIDKKDEQNLLREVAEFRKKNKTPNVNNALVGQRLSTIYSKHPYLPTGVALSLAEANAPMDMVDQIAQKATLNKYEKTAEESQQPKLNSAESKTGIFSQEGGKIADLGLKARDAAFGAFKWVLGNTLGKSDKVKTASRYLTAFGQTGPETIANYASRLTDPNRGTNDTENFWASTSLGALLQNPDKAGSGFFVGGEAEETRREKVRKYRWQLANKDSYTIGRGTANMLFTPGSTPYSILSGFIDAGINWNTDPTNKPVDYVMKARKASKILPFVETADEMEAARKLARGEAGLMSNAEEHAVDTGKFFNWLDNSVGKRTVQRTAEETNELKILEAYNYRISPENARKLAQTTDPNEVRGIIAEATIRLSDETSGAVPFATSSDQLPITKLTYGTGEKIPGYNAIKNNPWLAKVPKNSLLISGTPKQKAEGIKNLKNWLLTLNVDPYSGEGQNLMEHAFTWAGADGTRADGNKMINLFLGNEDEKIVGVLPTALKQSGVKEDVIKSLTETLRGNENALRKYSFDSAGVADDHGVMVHLSQFMNDDEMYGMLSELFPTRITPDMSRDQLDLFIKNLEPGELMMDGPMSLAQMLNNTVMLPDPRAIRKLTTNPFFRNTARGKQAQVSAALEYVQNDVWRSWALATVGFVMRNTFDAQTRIAMSGIARGNWQDYMLMAMNRKGVGSIMGETWKSAQEVPTRTLFRIAKSDNAENIIKAIDEYVGINTYVPDEIIDDLIAAEKIEDVRLILDRIRPDSEYMEDFTDVSRSLSKHMVEDPRNQINQLVKTNQFDTIDVSSSSFPQAMIDQAGIINNDPLQRMAVQLSHLPEDRQIDVITRWLDSGTRDAVRARRAMVDRVSSTLVSNATNGQNKVLVNIEKASELSNKELADAWYGINAREQTLLFTRDSDELRAFAGYNSVPVDSARMVDLDFVTRLNGGVEPKVGDIIVQPDEFVKGEEVISRNRTHLVLERHVQKSKDKAVKTFKLIEVVDPGTALSRKFDETGASFRAKDFVRKLVAQSSENRAMGLDPLVPDYALGRIRVTPQELKPNEKLAITASNAATWLPRTFFRFVVDPATRNLERSPAWRRIYYNHIADNAHLLSPEEAQKIFDMIEESAQKAFPNGYAKNSIKAMEDYIGGKPVLDALGRATEAAPGAVGTAEQLQQYASTLAKMDAEEIFFNNVNRSNFTDAMRIVGPFGAAWAEIFGTYAKAVVQNPARLRKAQMVYRGAEGTDPENDGRGFIWTDPQSKLQMFAFPLSGLGVKAFTALTGKKLDETFLAAPTQRLSAGFSIIPSLGPIYQIAATALFNAANIPDTDSIRKVVLPYGDSGLKNLIPGTWQKMIDAIDADPSKLNTVYGNTYQDVFAHLSTTGDYDLSSSEDVTRMDQDAQAAARGVTIVRAISQFVGPTAATPQYRYKNEAGEYFYVNEMVKTFSDLQNENYDTAVKGFIEKFGLEAMIYLSGKTKTDPAYKGVEANESYGRWERENNDLISSYKTTAPFLAPGAFGEFSMEVYSRQLSAGMRKDRDNRDRLADAQRRIGSALYKNIRNQYPETLSDGQRLKLKEYRSQIHKQYPGFPETAEFTVGEFENFVSDLGRLVQDPRTEGNKVADSIYEYLKYRSNVKTSLKNQYGVSIDATKSAAANNARGMLYSKGEQLATVNPDFRRIWEQELSSEVE